MVYDPEKRRVWRKENQERINAYFRTQRLSIEGFVRHKVDQVCYRHKKLGLPYPRARTPEREKLVQDLICLAQSTPACPYFGVPLIYSTGCDVHLDHKIPVNKFSEIDQLSSEMLQWTCGPANRAKWQMSDAEFREFLSTVRIGR